MKKKVLEKFEEINEERKISKELKNKLLKLIFQNLWIAMSVMVLFISLIFSQMYCSKESSILIYKLASLILLITSIIIIERAYKKDSGTQAIQGIEVLVIALFVLFGNYIIIKGNIFTKLIGVYIAGYYIIKTIFMYESARTKYLQEITDIKEIVKKESQDKIKQIKEIEKLEKSIKKETKSKKTTKSTTGKTKQNKEVINNSKSKKSTEKKSTKPKKTTSATKNKTKTDVAKTK